MRNLLLCLVYVCFAAAAARAQTTPENPLAHDQQTFDQAAAEYDAGHYEAAYKLFLVLAGDNDIAAARNVAMMKRKGLGCARDPQGALDYMKQAAEGGLATAAADLADMLLDGEAGPPDVKAALPWLEAAAKAGHPRAQYRLGEMFETGNVVPKDLNKAQILYGEAAASGMPGAGERLEAVKAQLARESPTTTQPNAPPNAAEQPRP